MAEVELDRMKNILEGIVDDEYEEDIPYILGPIHKVNFEEWWIAGKIDDVMAKMRYGDKVNEEDAYIYTDPTKDFPWYTTFMVMTFIFIFLVMLICFFKPDFLCLTIAATSYYIVSFYRNT